MEGGDLCMSSIDERVVNMKFNNSQFTSGVKQTTDSLDSLKKSLNLDAQAKSLQNLDDAGKKFSLQGMAQGIDTIAGKFSALSIAGITALANLTSKAVDAGLQFVKSFTFQPIIDGLHEFETNMNSIQTVLANTSSKGTTLDQVNAALAQLNTYSDKTIYNFSEMAKNIGTFTAAGVGLDASVSAIKGIANLAAVSGSSADQASTAMYQLSQAIAGGVVRLQDWNSVVNAGMGGQGFQDALKRTARVHGVAVDDMIKKDGSFRDSLQENWLSAQILTETLSTYTGDLSASQLKSMGYSDQQITEILKMGKVAQDAATKVKTATQLLDTLKEAVGSGWTNTFQIIIGNFKESQDLFTGISNSLGGMISASANARNKLLSDWKALGGRAVLIDAIRLAFKALMDIVKPISNAFREIFPATTGKQLYEFTKAIHVFAENLQISGTAANNVKRTFAGVFAIFDIGFQVIKQVVVMFARLFGQATAGASGFLSVTASIGDFFVALDKAIKNGEGLTNFFTGLGNVLAVPIALIRAFVGLLFQLGSGLAKLDFSGVTTAVGQLAKHFQPLEGLGNAIAAVWSHVGNVMAKVWQFFQPVARAMGDFFSGLGKAISSALTTGDFSTVLDIINTGLFGGLVLLVRKFLKDPKIGVDIGGGLIDSIKGAFGGLTDTLKTMQQQVKSKVILNIAIAVGILAASLVALSLLDSGKLAGALGGITVLFTELVGSLAILEKIMAKDAFSSGKLIAISIGMMGIATAMLILAGAVAILAHLSWDQLARGLVGAGVGLGILAGAMFLFSKVPLTGLIAGSAALVVGATGLVIMAAALKILSSLSWDDIGRSMVALAGSLVILAVGLTLLAASLPGAGSLVIASVGLLGLGLALQLMSKLSWDDIGRSMVALAGSLIILAAGLTLMDASLPGAASLVVAAGGLLILGFALQQIAKLNWDDIGRSMVVLGGSLLILAIGLTAMIASGPGAAALTIAATALVILAGALLLVTKLSWEDIGKSMVVLAGSLLILAVGLTAMVAALPGAAALLVAAAALTILVPVLALLGNMGWDVIGTGLGALAATLGLLAIAGVALLPAIPGLLGLGLAITLLGAGVLAAGIGVSAFAIGLTALSVAGAAGALALTALFSAVIAQIPIFLQSLAVGLIGFVQVLLNAAPVFLNGMVVVITTLLTAINTVAPAIIQTLWILVTNLVNVLVAGIPFFVNAGLKIIVGVLNGITANLPKIFAAGTALIIQFINGIQGSMNKIADAAMKAVVKFVNTLADSIRSNSAKMQAAGDNLAGAIIDGMVGGISHGIGRIISAAQDMASSALNAAKSFLGIHSPSKEFFKVGGYSTEGFAKGLVETSGVVAKAATNVGNTAMMSLQKSISGLSDKVAMKLDFQPVITPVLDLSNVDAGTNKIATSFQKIKSLSLDSSYNSAVQATQGAQAVQDAKNPSTTTTASSQQAPVVFNQYNNSPKALSEAEIYRKTNNQLSVAKKELTTPDA
jgi:tape measure domain-containing protein